MKKGDEGWVVAPSLISKQPGDRGTTDRRDSGPRARLARSGELTAVSVPTGEDEAMRDRTRARAAALSDLTDAKCRLQAFVLRPASRDVGRAHGGPAHVRWLAAGVCPTPAQPIVFQDYVRAVQEPTARRPRLEPARHDHVHAWRVHPVVAALQALRGVHGTVAVTMVAASGELRRVDHPPALMKGLGLMPSASSAGEHRRQGAMTTAGHTHARRALGAGAGAYRDPAKGSRPLPRRLEHQPTIIQDRRGNVQGRRCQCERRLVARGQHAHVVTVAMTRARAGFRWAMAREVPVTP